MKKQIILLLLVLYGISPLIDLLTSEPILQASIRIICAVPLYYLFGYLVASLKHEKQKLESEYKIAKMWHDGYFVLEKQFHTLIMKNITEQLDKVIENTEITNYVVNIKDNKLTCKIGNEETLITVDTTSKVDFFQALDEAYKKFLQQR